MSLIFLDQNALILLGKKARGSSFRETLDAFIDAGDEVFVLSFWHLVETSYGSSPSNSAELADFIESLKPAWLLERHELLALDVLEAFYGYLHLDHKASPRVVTRSDMFTALDQYTGGPAFRGTLSQFVALWRKHRVELGYSESASATTRLRQAKKCGKLNGETKMRAARELIKSVLPKSTPSGLAIPPDATSDYLSRVDPSTIPSVALDIAVSEFEWAEETKPGRGRNALIDKFHILSALPYVDYLVTDDHFFHAVYDSVNQTGHVRARVLHCSDFVKRFE